uniref:Uncharacterized protein n=1 Tax=viral metagenome TaxID=1070528 RepID=A0A6C0JE34_9ZZZZ
MKCNCKILYKTSGLRQCNVSCWFDTILTSLLTIPTMRHHFKEYFDNFNVCENISCKNRVIYLTNLSYILGIHDLNTKNTAYRIIHQIMHFMGNKKHKTIINENIGKKIYTNLLVLFRPETFLDLPSKSANNFVLTSNSPIITIIVGTTNKVSESIYYALTNKETKFTLTDKIVTKVPLNLSTNNKNKYKLQTIIVSTSYHVFSYIFCENHWVRYDNEKKSLKIVVENSDKYFPFTKNDLKENGYLIYIYIKK